MFKKGDFIKVKPNIKLKSGDTVNNWGGEVGEVNHEKKCCLVILDAQTLDSFQDSNVRSFINDGVNAFTYVFEYKDIELSERRDSDKQVKEAVARLTSRMISLLKESVYDHEEFKEKWKEEFNNSVFYNTLNEFQKENAGFVIGTFTEFMFNYEEVEPQEWTPLNILRVCLEIVPGKISADEEIFENYGEILIQFLKFLGNENYISNSHSLAIAVEKIKDKIPIEAKNSDNWGLTKSMMMSAQKEGLDLSNEEDIKKYMLRQQLGAMEEKNQAKIIPLKKDPFKGIGRNQKITIKYEDGRILEDVKFKKVESDLRNGDCEIIKK